MKLDNIFIAGIGTYLPERVTTADAVANGWYGAAEREAGRMISVAVGGDVPAPDMARFAAEEALKRSEHDPDDFDRLIHSIVHHQGPDGWSAPHYILRHTVNRPIPALEVRHGCLGILSSMELASAALLARNGPGAALLTAADNYGTPYLDRWRSGGVFLMADGGSAVVLSSRGGFARLLAVGTLSDPEMEQVHRGGEQLFPPGITQGVSLNLDRRMAYWREQWAQGVTPPMSHAGDVVTEVVSRTLGEAGLTMADITRVAHPGVNWDLLKHGFLDPLGVSEEQGTWEFTRRLGHAGATDQIAGLEHLLRSGEVGPGDHVLLLSKTSGMEAGAAVVRIEGAL
ncbi:3-oxoacyl-ACP synthase [Nonomuraea sp. NN258]|uniref:ketoacyl-ACP synthase III family protein n=1 Tax=Nonomuraea antri TaxID=2730852 RepID=UPI00156A3730|nr:ketoacyl-ACP synthase III family protein [Nonomuraea antri]NRQ35172.1 3-oxoacyl-ACP synthase [Nonomuraea antri]